MQISVQQTKERIDERKAEIKELRGNLQLAKTKEKTEKIQRAAKAVERLAIEQVITQNILKEIYVWNRLGKKARLKGEILKTIKAHCEDTKIEELYIQTREVEYDADTDGKTGNDTDTKTTE